MNIALAPNSFTPFTGGVSVFTRQLARGLTERGHRVVVVTSDRKLLILAGRPLDTLVVRELNRAPLSGPTAGRPSTRSRIRRCPIRSPRSMP